MRFSRPFGALLSLCSLTLMLTGCGDETATPETTTSSSSASSSGTTSTSESPSPTTSEPEPTTETSSESVATAEPTPVGCEPGFGPVITHWSDGTVGGWSQMCQDQLDQSIESERLANLQGTAQLSGEPQCDETQCTYPNGYVARIGDPDAPNYLKPGNSPWVQGQIDWQNCLESGKTQEQCRAELN
ncbi:hypothetical protein [Corynebacterium frankenforstense]|uniref:hypothetical protein n=1 Tax=Corynebacterium frankenforstense TaxID=1230998 RepID=UPI0026EC3FDD|nr:hypothetical protein [Corynebacterium frankenforstense]